MSNDIINDNLNDNKNIELPNDKLKQNTGEITMINNRNMIMEENIKNRITNELKNEGIEIDLNLKTFKMNGVENLDGKFVNFGSFMKFTVTGKVNGNEYQQAYMFDCNGKLYK